MYLLLINFMFHNTEFHQHNISFMYICKLVYFYVTFVLQFHCIPFLLVVCSWSILPFLIPYDLVWTVLWVLYSFHFHNDYICTYHYPNYCCCFFYLSPWIFATFPISSWKNKKLKKQILFCLIALLNFRALWCLKADNILMCVSVVKINAGQVSLFMLEKI